MLKIKKRYVVNERNEPVAVQLDLETFAKIERLLEDYALGQSIRAVKDERSLDLREAQRRYARLKKTGNE
ncbi:MAG: hypothetical protein NUW06_04910 [Candidatus Acetothermia bacterium]|nr:hypothetical protein [Candidatus Acetothermia bacterium]MDH7505199.1 hypothetical protein [Candidatus Acetothermia bacterium]